MTLFKYVNGTRLAMTPEEEASFVAEQAAFEAVRLSTPVSLLKRLSAIFEQASSGVSDASLRAHFRGLQVQVSFCLSNPVGGDTEAAKYIIQNAKMPDGSPLTVQFQPLQAALLAEFE